MGYIFRKEGFAQIRCAPCIGLEEGSHDQMVDLRSWLKLVEIDSDIEEITIPNERPHYRFKNKEGKEIIIAYVFGYIIAKDPKDFDLAASDERISCTSKVLQDYTDHLNDLQTRIRNEEN
jgi:hypothetical protein